MFRSILVPTDGSRSARRAVEYALDLARHYDAIVHVLYVVDVPGGTEPITDFRTASLLERREAEGRQATAAAVTQAEELGVPVVSAVRTGTPSETILSYAEEVDADLIVMGTQGRSGLVQHLLGGVADRVVRTARRPVLLVRSNA